MSGADFWMFYAGAMAVCLWLISVGFWSGAPELIKVEKEDRSAWL